MKESWSGLRHRVSYAVVLFDATSRVTGTRSSIAANFDLFGHGDTICSLCSPLQHRNRFQFELPLTCSGLLFGHDHRLALRLKPIRRAKFL